MNYAVRFLVWAALLLLAAGVLCALLVMTGLGMLSVPIVLVVALAGAPWTFLYWIHNPGTSVVGEAVVFSGSVLVNAFVLGLIVARFRRTTKASHLR